MNDAELIAKLRYGGAVLRRRPGDFDRELGWLLKEVADRLGESVTTTAPEVIGPAWCKGCNHATLSEPCPKCGNPACAKCGLCPPCDGDITEGSND